MTPLDTTAVGAVLLAAVVGWRRPRLALPTAVGAVGLLGLQALAAARWQYVPAYVAAAVLLSVSAVRAAGDVAAADRGSGVPVAAIAVPLALVTLAAGTALPVLSLSAPTGVGTTSYTLLDDSRSHPSGPAGVPRALPVQVLSLIHI